MSPRPTLTRVLAATLTLQAFAPPAMAADDSLEDAFSNFKAFARDAEEPVAAPAPAPAAAPPRDASSRDHLYLTPGVYIVDDLVNPTHDILGEEQRAFAHRIDEVLSAMGSEPRVTSVVITKNPLHEVTLRAPMDLVKKAGEPGHHQFLTISVGTLAMVENVDELAGVIAQAVALSDPVVYGHRDDPRVTRRLEEQAGFDRLVPSEQRRILADLSAIERLRACGLRPWGLTDFELRTFTYFRDQWATQLRFMLSRRKVLGDTLPFYADKLFEARILAQKVAIAYLQERENIRDLVKTPHPFDPDLRAIHRRARARARGGLSFFRPILTALSYPLVPVVPIVFGSDFFMDRWAELGARVDQALRPALDGTAYQAAVEVVKAGFALGHATFGTLFSASWAVAEQVVAVVAAAVNFVIDLCRAIAPILIAVFTPIVNFIWWVCSSLDAGLVQAFDYLIPALTPARWFIVTCLLVFVLVSKWTVPAFRNTLQGWGEGARFSYYSFVAFFRSLVRGGYIESLVAKTPPARRAGLFEELATDLRLIYTDAVRGPDFGLNFPWGQLGPLQSHYTNSTDYPRFLRQTLEALTREVREGRVSAADAVRILDAWSPELPIALEADRFTKDRREAQPLLQALRGEGSRRRLTALYRAVRADAPGREVPLTEVDPATVPWAELNGAATPASDALGVLRVIAEAEDVRQTHDLTRLPALHELVYKRLRRFDVINRVHRANFATIASSVFAGDFDLDLAERLRTQIADARAVYHEPDSGRIEGNGWPLMRWQFTRARTRALLAGRLGPAAALSTWVSAIDHTRLAIREAWALPVLVAGVISQTVFKEVTDEWLRYELGRRRTVRDIARFVNAELVDRAAVRRRVTPIVYAHVLAHPGVIAEMADVDALIDDPIFWPTEPMENQSLAEGFLTVFRGYGAIDRPLGEALRIKKIKYPRVWTYQSNLAEDLHLLIKQRLREMNRWPEDYEGLKATWRRLSERGVTAETDRLLQRLIEIAPDQSLSELMALVIEEGRIWETALHSRLSIAQLQAGAAHKKLLATAVDDPARPGLLDEVIEELQSTIPERGLAYASFLENLSIRLKSSYAEARAISRAKAEVVAYRGRDSNIEAMEGVFHDIQRWPKPDQLAFIRFLRGDRPANRRIRMAFPVVGLERIRRMYEVLPTAARVGVLDTFLTHSLIGQDRFSAYWTRRLATQIVGRADTEAQRVTLQVLTAFLFAVGEVGNQQMVTTILSYLYALPSTSTAQPVEVLKLVLEIFGATGIKVGQFIYASQVLGPQGDALRSLQSRARVPDRIELYEDVYDLLGVPVGEPLPFAVLDLLGAASMKYAFLAQDRANLAKLVVKVFRLDAMNNVDLQFDVLEHLGDYLIRRFGAKYGPFKVIIKTARRAVKREGSMPNEIRRSRIARHHVYRDFSTDDITVEVPKEDLVNARMVISQYAEGVPFDELPEPAKPMFAKLLLEMENDIVFADRDVVRFDPDRHAGNSQLLFRVNDRGDVVLHRPHRLQPIDFGQLLRLTRSQRERIIKLFALAQIAVEARGNAWSLRQIAKLLDLNEEQRRRLGLRLGPFARGAQKRPVSRYMSVLAALEASGYAIRDSIYVDFVRGIIQLTPFERHAPDARAPSRTFERAVREAVQTYAADFAFDPGQLRLIGMHNGWQRVRSWFTGKSYRLYPTDLRGLNFDEFIHRESDANCERALAIAE